MNLPDRIKGILSRNVRIFGYDARTQTDYAAEVDTVARGIQTIDTVHAHTHAGILYETSHLAEAVAAGGTLELLITVSGQFAAHLQPSFISEGPALLELFEAPTVTGAGTPINVINRNRRSYAPAANTIVAHTPTTSADGTSLISGGIPVFSASGPGGTSSGGEGSTFYEWVLKEDTQYLLRITNTHSSTAFDLWASLLFYEQKLKL